MSGLDSLARRGRYDYEHDGAGDLPASFATIRAETDLSTIPADAEKVAVRMVHASGQTDLTRDLGDPRRPGVRRPRRAARRRADPVRRAHGRLRRHAGPAAPRQRGALHPARPAGARPRRGLGHHPLGRRRVAVGGPARRRRGRHRQRPDRAVPPARDDRRRSAAAGGHRRRAGRLHRRRRVQGRAGVAPRAGARTSWSAAAAAAPRWRPPRSTRWPRTPSERPAVRRRAWVPATPSSSP